MKNFQSKRLLTQVICLNNVLENNKTSTSVLNEDQVFLVQIMVNIFLIQEDSNSHPVFGLNMEHGRMTNQVGLRKLAKCKK